MTKADPHISKPLFIALSTGQNIANLLPILEVARIGDRILWIESATALKRGWSTGALDVLACHGHPRPVTATLPDDDPASVYRLLSDHPLVGGAAPIYLVANGGTKLQMAAASRALAGRTVITLYNSDAPCRLERVPDDPSAALESAIYGRHRVDLPDFLACRGLAMLEPVGHRVWPDDSGTMMPQPYGNDAEYTVSRHDALWAWYQGNGEYDAEFPSRDRLPHPRFEDALRLLPARVDALRRTIRHSPHVKDGKAKTVYHCALNLADQTSAAIARAGCESPAAIGAEFEKAVLHRLTSWLDAEPRARDYVQSIWRDVRIARPGAMDTLAQLDIAIALKNGVLLSLECKSFNAPRKDLDARIAVLQRSASQLARMGVCAPWFTGYRDRPWFPAMEETGRGLRAWGQVTVLPMTLPGQPTRYENANGVMEYVTDFESALASWLKPFFATEG